MNDEVLRVVAGAVLRDGRLMVTRRGPTMSGAGGWECPGGKVEAGETDAEALRRELQEELRIDVCVGEHIVDVRWPREGARDLLLVVYACSLERGEPQLTEHDALRWVEPVELDTLSWQAADRPAVEPIRRLMRREVGS